MSNYYSDKSNQIIQHSKKQLNDLLKLVVDIHYTTFQQTVIYSKMQNFINPFNYKEQRILEKEIHSHFALLTHCLRQQCPSLTKKELLICCLSFRFPMRIIGLCLGYTSTNNIRQHKMRIKKKMINSDNSILFDCIFFKKEDNVTL